MSSVRASKRHNFKRQRTFNKSGRRMSLQNSLVAAMGDGDTDNDIVSDENISDQDPEEIMVKIQEQKEIIANVRSRPWPMRKKLRVLNAARMFVEKHEGRFSKKNSYSEAGKEFFRKVFRFTNNVCSSLTPWDSRIKTIESYFGSSVASYFVFLRWLVQVNVILGTFTTAFLVVPEILVGNHDAEYKKVPKSEISSAWDLSTIWALRGYIQHSVAFYGYYTNDRVVGNGYRLPLAYFLVGMSMFAYSFVALLRKMAKNSRLSGTASSDDDFAFSWRLFTSWDYMIGNSETAENKSAAIATAMREAIVEEQEKEKKQDTRKKLKIFLRILANVLVLLLLAGSLYSIQFAVTRVQSLEDVERDLTFYEQNELSIVVTVVTMVTPSLFEVIGTMENYHPRNALRIQLARILMLYLGNLYSLMIGLLGHVSEASAINTNIMESTTPDSTDFPSVVNQQNYSSNFTLPKTFPKREAMSANSTRNTECWETYVGQELVKLSIIDLISTIITILIVDFFRALFVRYFNKCWCWDLENKFPEYGEFKIAENVLHLIYNQGITWVGCFFCPVLPLINVVKLIIMMYIRSWSVVTCNIPHQRVFRASRSNNFYLAMLLFMLFLSLLPTMWVIVWHPPSNCGPFTNREWMYTIVSETLENDLPKWMQDIIQYVATPVIILPALLLLFMIIYYLQAVARSAKETNARLKLQLHYERKEGKNIFLMGAGKKRAEDAALNQEVNPVLLEIPEKFSPDLTPISEQQSILETKKPKPHPRRYSNISRGHNETIINSDSYSYVTNSNSTIKLCKPKSLQRIDRRPSIDSKTLGRERIRQVSEISDGNSMEMNSPRSDHRKSTPMTIRADVCKQPKESSSSFEDYASASNSCPRPKSSRWTPDRARYLEVGHRNVDKCIHGKQKGWSPSRSYYTGDRHDGERIYSTGDDVFLYDDCSTSSERFDSFDFQSPNHYPYNQNTKSRPRPVFLQLKGYENGSPIFKANEDQIMSDWVALKPESPVIGKRLYSHHYRDKVNHHSHYRSVASKPSRDIQIQSSSELPEHSGSDCSSLSRRKKIMKERKQSRNYFMHFDRQSPRVSEKFISVEEYPPGCQISDQESTDIPESREYKKVSDTNTSSSPGRNSDQNSPKTIPKYSDNEMTEEEEKLNPQVGVSPRQNPRNKFIRSMAAMDTDDKADDCETVN